MHHRPISYGQLIRLPNVLALLAATCLSRLAGRMFAIALVLHILDQFGSPMLAGWVGFAAMAPGLVVSPLAGAFLDRAGAVRGIVVDLAVGGAVAVALAICVAAGWADPTMLICLATLYALTSPLSAAGIRVLLPRLVPAAVLDRANALDTAVYAVVDVIGPSLAGALMGFAGPIIAYVTIATAYAAAMVCVALVRGTAPPSPPSRNFFRQALEALGFVVRRPLLRGLAVGYALNNFTWGVLWVAIPALAAARLEARVWESVSGLIWAGVGLAGGIGAMASGQLRMVGREVRVMVVCMGATALAVWPVAIDFGLPGLVAGLLLAGVLAGPIDVGLLTLRQRRTDPAQLGRVLTVSMSLNMAGFPIGTALGGILVASSPESAFVAAALASLVGAVATAVLVPEEDAAADG